MLKRILGALAATTIMVATPVGAQTIGGWTVPSDLRNQPGGGWVDPVPTFAAGSGGNNNTTDASVTPPANQGLTNIPIPTDVGRISVSNIPEHTSTGTGCTGFGLVLGVGGDTGCGEAKFRTHADFSHYAPDDPIRNFGQPGVSHLHCFFGAGVTNANSTWDSLRNHAISSTAAGTDVNGTGYWYPCMIVRNRDGDGKNYVIKPNIIIVYYVRKAALAVDAQEAMKQSELMPGLRYVIGYNMDTGTNANFGLGQYMQDVVDAANAANVAAGGSSTRYKLKPSGTFARAIGGTYNCVGATAVTPADNGNNSSYYLQEPDGSDPFNGTCNGAHIQGYVAGSTLTVTNVVYGTKVPTGGIAGLSGGGVNPATIINGQLSGTPGGVGTYTVNVSQTKGSAANPIEMDATQDFFIGDQNADCWDGKNLWSPSGYKHVVRRIYDGANDVCPNGYYAIPPLALEISFTQYGWPDRQRWELASDLARRTALGGTQTGTAGGNTYPNGFSFHTDWMNGWDHNKQIEWEKKCLGVLNTPPHQCAVSQINGTSRLTGGIIDGEAGVVRNPQITSDKLPHASPTDSGWGLIPPSWLNSITDMHIHH